MANINEIIYALTFLSPLFNTYLSPRQETLPYYGKGQCRHVHLFLSHKCQFIANRLRNTIGHKDLFIENV